jgi:hypothetical protein
LANTHDGKIVVSYKTFPLRTNVLAETFIVEQRIKRGFQPFPFLSVLNGQNMKIDLKGSKNRSNLIKIIPKIKKKKDRSRSANERQEKWNFILF